MELPGRAERRSSLPAAASAPPAAQSGPSDTPRPPPDRAEEEEPARLPPALDELRSAAADFPPGSAAHPVDEAFGVRRFITVQPATEPGVNNESKARILLSSLHIALRDAAWWVMGAGRGVGRLLEIFFFGCSS